jgi:hypothetical protein
MKVAAAASAAAGRILGAPAKERIAAQIEAAPMLQAAAADTTPINPTLRWPYNRA